MMNSDAFQKSADGRLRMAIKEEHLTVAPETGATLHVGIFNNGPYEDEIELSVKGVSPELVSVPTPIVHLASGEAKLITPTIQPPAMPDHRVAQYTLDIRAASLKDSERFVLASSLLTVAAYQATGRIGVLLGSVHFSANPGSMIDIPILLQNRGEVDDTFRLNVLGLPESWISINSALNRLEPNESREILVTLLIPRSSEATAGRNSFKFQILSQLFPNETAEVDCMLTIGTFLQFSASLEPGALESGQIGQLIINNEGNTADTYSLSFQSPENLLIFEKAVEVAQPEAQRLETSYEAMAPEEMFHLGAGERGVYSYRAGLGSRPLIASERNYPFTVTVRSMTNESAELVGQVIDAGWIPFFSDW